MPAVFLIPPESLLLNLLHGSILTHPEFHAEPFHDHTVQNGLAAKILLPRSRNVPPAKISPLGRSVRMNPVDVGINQRDLI